MKKVYSDVIQFRGTHYDFGFLQGTLLKDSLTVKNREKQWKIRKPRFQVPVQEAKEVILHFAPGLWEEIIGLQDALQWPLERALLEFSGYRVNITPSGCSIVTGEDFLIRNYDYHPKTYDGRFTLFQPRDHGYAVIGPSQKITGRMDGMNEKGLAMGYNFINRKKPGDGFVCNVIGRILLETCSTAKEAVQLLKEIPHRGSYSYVVIDANGSSFTVEATPRKVIVREGSACTNHFEQLVEENRHYLVDSKRRLEVILSSQKEGPMTAKQAFELLNGTEKGVFSKLYKDWAGTIHTSGYLPKELKMWFALGGDQQPIEIDFSRWLQHEDLPFKKIFGEVDTDIPFVHMDENADWYQM